MLKENITTILCLLTLRATVVAYGSTVPRPQAVQFHSFNLRNTVMWTPGFGTPNGTHYAVEYAIYGDEEEGTLGQVRWRVKRQCRVLNRTWCDLSNETYDLEDQYYARVRAVGRQGPSEWTITEQFNPKLDTVFGPPVLRLTLKIRYMDIKLRGPMRWKTETAKREFPMLKYYPQMLYNLSVNNTKTKKMWNFILTNKSMGLNHLDFSTEYCVLAVAYFKSLPYKAQASRWQCVTTEKDPQVDQMLVLTLGCVVPSAILLFMFILIVYLTYHYVFGSKQRHPPNLLVPHLQEQKFCPDIVFTVNHIHFTHSEMWQHEGKPETPLLPSYRKSGSEQEPLVTRCSPYAAQAPQDMEAQERPNENTDYGIIVKAAEESETGSGSQQGLVAVGVPAGLSGTPPAYRRQSQAPWVAPSETEPVQEDCNIVDWDPATRMLQIPLFIGLQQEPVHMEEDRPDCDQTEPLRMLSTVYIRQSSGESTEFEDDLTKMENSWALQVNMEK